MHKQATLSESIKLIEAENFNSAIVTLRALISEQPDSYQAWSLLSKCLFEVGDLKQAVQASVHAQSIDPLIQSFQQIQNLLQQLAFSEAKQIANTMLAKYPAHPRAICTLAHIATKQNDPERSVSFLESAINFNPADLTLQNMLTHSYASAGYFSKAIQAANMQVVLDERFESLLTLIGLLLKYGQYDNLLAACERARRYVGQSAQRASQIDLIKGQALRIIGNKTESIAALKASLGADPLNADAWWALADMKDYAFSDIERADINKIVNATHLDKRKRCIAAFALAKASEGQSSPTQMMSYYHQANALGVSEYYEPSLLENEFNMRTNTYTTKNLIVQADSVEKRITPIFIVGLPRSGSTLVEQILASHSAIEATLEQPTLPIIESRAQTLCMQRYGLPLPHALDKLSPEELSQLGNAYLEDSALFRTGSASFFIDKQPFNFRLVGFIHKILPHAIVIDVRRNSLDCSFSLYKQYFHSGVDFSYNLSHIGAAYNAYVKLMDHWDNAIPSKVYKLEYESLVNDPEVEIHKLLAKLGVPFEQKCLSFHKIKRNIHTASSEQVRKPLNRQGIGAWRKVEDQLSDLINIFNKDGAGADNKH